MTDDPSPSAFRVAHARAAHQLLERERVFGDSYAIAVLGSKAAAELLLDPTIHNNTSARSFRAGIVARSRYAEDCLLKAIAKRTKRYAVIGAGLDAWALRAAWVLPEIQTFELDYPAMVQWKRELYKRNGWRSIPGLTWVANDLLESTSIDALERCSATFSEPFFLSALGVFVYLPMSCVEHQLAALRRLAVGSSIVLDYRVDDALLNPLARIIMQQTACIMASGGEHWLSSSCPEKMQDLLQQVGFRVQEDIGPRELNARYFKHRRDGFQIAGEGFRHLIAVKEDWELPFIFWQSYTFNNVHYQTQWQLLS